MRGFTLVEMLVVMGLIAFLLSIGLTVGLSSISRSSLASERDLVTLMLTGARARALANVNETSHGVRIEASRIVVFEGAPPGTNQRSVERNPGISVSPSDAEVVFEPLTARTTGEVIVLKGSGQEATIDINAEGRIEW